MIEIGGASHAQGIIFRTNDREIEVKTFPIIEIGNVKLSNKGKKDNREIKIIIPFMAGVFVFDEIFFGNTPWYIFRPIVIAFLVIMIISTLYYFGIKSFSHMRMNHGAEHKAIMAYRNGKIDELGNVSRFTKWCGGNIVAPVLIMISLGDWIRYPFTLSLAYYLSYFYIQPERNILYKFIGKPIQFLLTKEPDPEILEAAKVGLLKLIYEEKKGKMLI